MLTYRFLSLTIKYYTENVVYFTYHKVLFYQRYDPSNKTTTLKQLRQRVH